MPRPRKWRTVCCLPREDCFGPLGARENPGDAVIMTVDEYETIRLIDLLGLTQEECARQMNIARTTVQGIYNDARKKLAECLIDGRTLKIRGGNYTLCEGEGKYCGCGRCHHHAKERCSEEENKNA
jgi:predicted DNA-binding protein (UPF0251 family)